MSFSSILIFVLASMPPPAEAIERCRAAHQADPGLHIACLEDALRNKPPAKPAVEIGMEQIEARERASADAPQHVSVRIVGISYDARERGTFRTADGQVWRETELLDRRPRLSPSKQYTARIERGVVGGYRLYVDGIRWMYKVERLE
jgi:hypothetical protein